MQGVVTQLNHRSGALAFGAVLIIALAAAHIPAIAAGPPTEAVKNTINEVIGILQDESLKKPEKADERRQRLEKAVSGRFSYEEMARRSLGAQWQALSEQQRNEFVEAFKTFLSNSYADRITGYTGEQVQYLNERLEQGYAEVRTKVTSNKSEIPLDYRLLNKGGDWRVYDVVIDGVSLISNYRGQFSKIMKSSGYEDLIDRLKKKSSAKALSPQP
jgi:phospholipid transport system substrate-binding protein